MKASEIAAALDMKVVIDGKTQGQIIGYTAGWVEIELPDTTVTKCRAKQLKLVPGQEKPNTGLGEDAVLPQHTEDEDKKSPTNDDPWEVTCPNCGHMWESIKTENYVCPTCKTKFTVRLHPDKSRYIIGLGETETGRDTVDIDDVVAAFLRGAHLGELYDAAAEYMAENISPENWFSKRMSKSWDTSRKNLNNFLRAKYEHLNPGMQRMSVGNLLRGALNRNQGISE